MKRTHSLPALALAASMLLLPGCGGIIQKADRKMYEEAAYNEAIDMYKQALDAGKGRPEELNAKIAEAYRQSNRPAQAAPYYKAAIDAGNKADSIRFQYPFALRAAGQHEEAQSAFEAYAESGRRKKWQDRAKLEAQNINRRGELKDNSGDYQVVNMGGINTPTTEYSPVLLNDELVFTASRSNRIYAQTGTPFTGIFRARLGDTASMTPTAFDERINTANRHEASATFSKDGKMMIFARSNDGSRKGASDVSLYMCRRNADGAWSEPEVLSISTPTSWDASPALSPDGQTLYFSSNREGGRGGNDLYRASLDKKGRWGKVTNLGADINTAGDEMFPYVSEDGKLYFASDGHPGYGNLDLFVATRDKDKGTSIENLGMPLNSPADDFALVMKNAYEGYFSSNRAGGKGDDDIYYFKNLVAEPKNVVFVANGQITGRSGGKDEGNLAGARVRLMEVGTNKAIGEATTDEQGRFSIPLGADERAYTVLIEKAGYFTKRDNNLTTVGRRPANKDLRERDNTIALNYANSLDRIKLQEAITIPDIYYDYDKSDIREDAARELDKVVTMLKDNPAITVELSSHTDDRGDDKYNQRLSQRRAEAAVAYIVSQGVEQNRITARGYGESRPIVKNAKTEEEWQQNRRTEFKVTKIAQN